MEISYGWVVVFATFMINGIVQGVIASSGILLNVLLDHFKEGKGVTGWIPALLGGLLLAVGPLSSFLVDKYGCRSVTIVGALVAAFGSLLSSLAGSVRFLIFSYGIVTGFGFGLMYLPQTIILAEWFKERRSTATGIGISGAGFGAFIIPPLSQYILKTYGWGYYFVLSGCLISVCCVFGLLLRSHPDARIHEKRDSGTAAPVTVGHFIRDPAFIVFGVSTLLFSGSYRIPFSFLPDYAVRQLHSSKSSAAYLLSYLGLASFLGRLLGGFIGDNQRHRRFLVMIGLIVASGLCVVMMGLADNYAQLALCSLGYGAASGGRVALNSIILADIFGLPALTQTFGLVCFIQGIAIFFGTPVAGWLADLFGDYRTSFILFGTGMVACASVLTLIPVNRRINISAYSEQRVSWFLRILPFALTSYLLGSGLVQGAQTTSPTAAHSSQPHFIFILADDLGWNDVGFHGYDEIATPNMDRLASEGIILNSYYAHYMCTPSRAALLTGKYPMRLGLHHHVLRVGEPRGLDVKEKILPTYLKELGYSTHLVGKWHLGYATEKNTPSKRGFDTFFGYYHGMTDYYNYTPTDGIPPEYRGFDLWDNLEPARSYVGQYATDLFAEKAVNIIRDHDASKPLFLFLSHLAPHYANMNDPVQAPKSYIDKFKHIAHEGRRKYAATVAVLDDSVQKVFNALEKHGMADNCVVIFASDNGGQGQEGVAFHGGSTTFSSNWPLRGAKASHWEGGIRVASFIWSRLLKTSHRVSTELYHVTDWLPTFYKLAGGSKVIPGIDGLDIWSSLSDGKPSPREEIYFQMDPIENEYALRWKQYKLMLGSQIKNGHKIDKWYEPEGGIQPALLRDVPGALRCAKVDQVPCDANVAPCLYDVIADPCEFVNLAQNHSDIVEMLMVKLRAFNATSTVPSFHVPLDPRAQTQFSDGLLKPWIKD